MSICGRKREVVNLDMDRPCGIVLLESSNTAALIVNVLLSTADAIKSCVREAQIRLRKRW